MVDRPGEAHVRKIAAGLFISLDGVVEFPERWGFQYMNEDLSKEIAAGIAQADAMLQEHYGKYVGF
jgi:hypothetical protein